jgi:RHS repeat-associated protein
VTHPDLSFVSFTYDLAGRRTVVTDERGKPTTYAYDAAYRVTGITDAANQTTSYGYDAMSNQTSVTDALSRVTNYEYDDFNRLKKITYPPAEPGASRLFETIAYDADGNITSRTDTAGRATSYVYDGVNRLTSTTDAANKTTTFVHDALSRVTSLTDAINQQYQFAYDALGRETQITRGGVSMSYVYDEVGNRIQRTDYNGVVTNYSYDNLNRLTTITYPSRAVTYAYDPLNNVTRATNENGSVYISYDNRYRVSSFSDPFYYGISYNYDTVGNRTKLKVNGATYATYTYDSVNRLTNLADSANLNFTYSYDAANRLTSRTAPNGVTSGYAYDGLNRLTSLMHTAGGNTLNGNLYTHNNANNISSWTTATTQKAYTYDAVDRLTNVSNYEMPAENYSYDGVGNRTASHLSATYGYQPFNKLTSTAMATYSYDNNGNLISRTDASGTAALTYNEEDQLTQVGLPNSVSVNYKYDGLGRRIQRTTNAGANERYVYDGHDALIDLNADWSVATTYFNDLGIDSHLRQTNSSTGTSYFLTDHLGSTDALTDIGGNAIEQLTYDSFGNSAGSARTRYDYTGRERDPDTGQLYYRARFYDPRLGRFISEDPIAFYGGDVNLYAYVLNNPLRLIDPEGTQGRSDRNFYPSDRNPQTGDGYGIYRKRVPSGCPSGSWGPVGALGDFWGNYTDMREVNTVGADKYFHCLANCEASRRGWSARKTAQVISELREILDRNVKGYPKEDCEADRHANNVGRLGGLGCRPCREVCAQFKPAGMQSPKRPTPQPTNWNNRSWGGGGKGW